MGDVTRLHHALPLGPEVAAAVKGLDSAIANAIDAAKAAGIPQGLVVGILHGHAHAETHKMVAK